jgi:hypothetical protein
MDETKQRKSRIQEKKRGVLDGQSILPYTMQIYRGERSMTIARRGPEIRAPDGWEMVVSLERPVAFTFAAYNDPALPFQPDDG